MNIGFQTISFGRTLKDHGRPMLRAISEMGYQGVEVAQSPSEFGSPKELCQCLREFRLRLLGLSCGSVRARVDFAARLIEAEDTIITEKSLQSIKGSSDRRKRRSEPETTWRVVRAHPPERTFPYIYLDQWDPTFILPLVSEYGFAIHTHMFTPFQTSREVEAVLGVYRNAWFLPDTAHLTVAGEDVLSVLYRNYDRIVAIHLKDWTSEFGRSYHFYARGFGVRFGTGDAGLHNIVEFLKKPEPPKDTPLDNRRALKPFDGWLIVEQDKVADPVQAAEESLRWLRRELEG